MTIKSVCRKSEAKVASMGSVLFQFDQKVYKKFNFFNINL